MSRSMLERYSHSRMNAKRQAVESLTLKPKVEPPPKIPHGEERSSNVATKKPV
jgi:hypothetical protein